MFETTIRILGGLLSAHLLAVDPTLGMTPPGYRDVRDMLARCWTGLTGRSQQSTRSATYNRLHILLPRTLLPSH